MTDSRMVSAEKEKNVLHYLKSQQVLSSNVDIKVQNIRYTGRLQIRKGQVVCALCGKLTGNGAFLTLAAMREAEISVESANQSVESNITLSLSLAERLLSKLPDLASAPVAVNEEEGLQQAIHLIYQFRRTEAGSKLVEILRSNRFYYPAWLWHSRLMTREEYIKKALAEARKWGNSDLLIQREAEKIEPQIGTSQQAVRRCIFCWSIVGSGEVSCRICQGMLRITEKHVPPEGKRSFELVQAVQAYEGEFQLHPENSRIAYCLSLGHFSLGNIDNARKYIQKALQISPREPIFTRATALLAKKSSPPVRETPAPAIISGPAISSAESKTILMVEDSQTSRKVLSMLLGRKGYTIIEAMTGAEALLRSGEKIPDLVLLDVMLPDMTGYEVLSRMRQSQGMAEVPVIMLTGKSKPSDRLKGLFHGSNEYLTKPFDPAKLLAILEKYLEQPSAKLVAPHSVSKENTLAAPARTGTTSRIPVTAKTPTLAGKSSVVAHVSRPGEANTLAPAVAVKQALPSSPAVLSQAKTTNSTGKTILVVEDSPTSRKVISMVLTKRGYIIEEAPTGGAALRRIEGGGSIPNLILLDAMLPDMTGYDILSILKKDLRFKDIPVVMLTAKNNSVDRQKGLQGGSAAYLTKPFDPEKLLAVIDENISAV